MFEENIKNLDTDFPNTIGFVLSFGYQFVPPFTMKNKRWSAGVFEKLSKENFVNFWFQIWYGQFFGEVVGFRVPEEKTKTPM